MHPPARHAQHPKDGWTSMPGLLKGRIEGRYWTQPRGRAGTLEPPRYRADSHHSRPTRGHNQPQEKDQSASEIASNRFVDRRFSVPKIDDRRQEKISAQFAKK